nr:MAG TPA: hypothetical protein [Caudoviricetes sp.]
MADFQVFQVACNHLLSMVVYTSRLLYSDLFYFV